MGVFSYTTLKRSTDCSPIFVVETTTITYSDSNERNEGGIPLNTQEESPRTRKEKKMKRKPEWMIKRKERKLALKHKRKQQHWFKRITFGFGRFVRRLLLAILLPLSIGLVGGILYYQANYEELVSSSIREGYEIAETIHPSHFEEIQPTIMLDGNGNTLREFKERNYKHLNLQDDDELYQKVSDVVTTIEDERFYKHEGFDYLGVGVAVIDYVRGGSLRGASTLTQQLVKNTYLSQEQTVERKLTEAVIAQKLEDVFTKREILEFYVNDAYYSHGNYGMETAAHYYFSKPTKELTHAQVATLIAIPNNPTIYDPINNPDNTIYRRNLVLELMARKELLPRDLVEEEKEKDLGLEITKFTLDNSLDDWAQSFAMESTVEELMRYEGFQFEYWFDTNEERSAYKQRYNDAYQRHYQNVLRGGYIIETSIDHDKQQRLQQVVDQNMQPFTAIDADGYYSKQAPSVVIDNRTNEVVAIVGGRSQENMGSFNRAYQSARQPGSATKPFLSFAPAIEKGLATETIRKDAPIKNGPGNWYSGYRGDMTLRYALTQSVNTVAYNLYQEVGMKFARNKLVEMEFKHLAPEDIYPTMSIGGWTYGTNPLEVASAVNTLANDGMYHRPTNVRKITSRRTDEVIYDRAEHEPKRVYESGVGYVTLNMMQSVISDGFNKSYSIGYPYEAGKSGSTNEYKELWFAGGTPYYSMTLYIGDNQPTAQNNRIVSSVLQNIYTDYMRPLHHGLDVIDFNRPQTVIQQRGNFWIRTSDDVDPQDSRKADEERRLSAIQNQQRERVDTLSYRIVHGLTLEQTEARERATEAQIEALEKYSLNGSTDMTYADRLLNEAEVSLEKVVREDIKASLSTRMRSAYGKIQAERAETIRIEEERIRLEEERIERERIAKELEEQRIREEEERLIREEEERIERERLAEEQRIRDEEERVRLEEERRIRKEQEEKEERQRREQEERDRLEQEERERLEQEELERLERERQEELDELEDVDEELEE